MAVSFTSQYSGFKLKDKQGLKQWIQSCIEKERKVLGTLHYVFLSDDELLKINVKFLDHNTYTDIITFDYGEHKKINGEIFISIDRVKENAKKFEVTFEDELHRVMIHGVLHLCGYKDKTKKEVELIRKKENSSLGSRRL